MASETNLKEYARLVIGGHTRKFIYREEVWDQLVEHGSPEKLRLFMIQLTPELHDYIRHRASIHSEQESAHERSMREAVRQWYDDSLC